MAFKIAQKNSYKVKVKVQTPSDNGFETSEFTAEFKRVGMAELEELKELPQREVIEKVLIGYTDLLDEDNKQVDYNALNVGILLDIPQAQLALTEAFWQSIFKAKEKN
jgi:hypothetical protein